MTLIWALMAIPVVVIVVFSALVIGRFAELTGKFEYFWSVGSQFDEINTLLASAKIDREIMNSRRQTEPSESLQSKVVALREKAGTFEVNQPFAEIKPLATQLVEQAVKFENAVIDLDTARLPFFTSGLNEKVDKLRVDSTKVLDPLFLQKVNEISDIAQVFSCSSRLTASRLLREDIDILLNRLTAVSLPLDARIQIHSNANAVRGEFAATLLACQDLERSFEEAASAFEQTSAIVSQLSLATNTTTLAQFDADVRSETLSLMTLLAAVTVVFGLGFAGTYVLSRRFGIQLARMTQAIRGVANNEREIAIPFVGAQDEFGELAANVVTFQDNADKLRHALSEARQASDSKTRFLATVSHELRTPLNAILGFSEIIQNGLIGPAPEKYREYGRDIHESAQVLLEQISQILDLSRIEMGQIDVLPEVTDVNEIVEIAMKRLENRIQAKNLTVHVHRSTQSFAWFDRRHLYQVISNVLDNAVKYNVRDGRIEVTHFATEQELSICITDTGIGMRADEVERAHEPFVQFEKSSDSLQGIGLGLSIVLRLTTMNGASFRIRSEKNRETSVTITMPRAHASRQRSVA